MNQKSIINVFVIAVLIATASPKSQAQSIHRQLQAHVPQITDYLNKQGHKTVGVLKFRVKKDGQKMSDSVGPLNSLIADRLEVGLILSISFNKAQQLQIIKDASAQVADSELASHLSAAGRANFFEKNYDMAWGSEKQQPDAFLTGVIQIHEDNSRCTIGILCFDKSGGELQRCGDVFEAELDASLMSELGESFVLRGAFDAGATHLTNPTIANSQVVKQAHAVKTQLAKFPLTDSLAPAQLEVRYDGRLMPIELRSGQAFLPEPKQGQRVELAIVRGNSAKGTLGIVVRVNGENTLGRETCSDLQCRKWLLTEQHRRTVIKGYQVDNSEAESFTVLSQQESRKRAINYGRYAGQIQMTVYREEASRPNAPPPPIPEEDEEDLIAMLRGIQPKQTPANLSALKGQIRTAGRSITTRGLIVAGDRTNNTIRTLQFSPQATPIMSATITYYTP